MCKYGTCATCRRRQELFIGNKQLGKWGNWWQGERMRRGKAGSSSSNTGELNALAWVRAAIEKGELEGSDE